MRPQYQLTGSCRYSDLRGFCSQHTSMCRADWQPLAERRSTQQHIACQCLILWMLQRWLSVFSCGAPGPMRRLACCEIHGELSCQHKAMVACVNGVMLFVRR